MASHTQGNDRKKDHRRGGETWSPAPDRERGQGRRRERPDPHAADWLWGWHPVSAALGNANRPDPERVIATAARAGQLKSIRPALEIDVLETADFARVLPSAAVHQGVAMRVAPPLPQSLDALAEAPGRFLVMLDQVTDPQNIGAIFRSAAAFGARGLILQDRHAPALGGALAKAAAGAIDAIPHARETNLSRALERLDELGWRAVALDGTAEDTLEATLDSRPTVLVLGAEGEGVRRLVREHCDASARIPMPGGFESLNVSAAAAVAFYEASRVRA